MGLGARVVPCPVISPVVPVKSQTGLKQHGLAASLIMWHWGGMEEYLGHLEYMEPLGGFISQIKGYRSGVDLSI